MEAFEIIRNTMGEFSDVDDNVIRTFISLAEDNISERKFGKLYQQAVAYLAAHKLKLNGYGDCSNGSPKDFVGVSSFSEGETSISFSANQQTNIQKNAEYSMTIYGIEFLTIKRKVTVPIISSAEGTGYV